MEYTAIIVDDEPKLREVMDIKIKQFCPEIKVIGKASNVPEAFNLINEKNPDIVFLDIAMPGESGFDLLYRFEKIDFQVIFATGFNEYALDALKLSAVDYILKPINTEDLKSAANKAIKNVMTKKQVEHYELLKYNIKNVGNQETKIALASSDSYEFIKISDIVRCEGWQKYTKIHLTNGNTIVSSYNIGVYKNQLENYDFFSCHKSHLINQHLISKYLKEGSVIMSDGSTVPVSRRKREEFLEQVIKVHS